MNRIYHQNSSPVRMGVHPAARHPAAVGLNIGVTPQVTRQVTRQVGTLLGCWVHPITRRELQEALKRID